MGQFFVTFLHLYKWLRIVFLDKNSHTRYGGNYMITDIEKWIQESLTDEDGKLTRDSLSKVLKELDDAQIPPCVTSLTFPDLPEIQRYADLVMLCIMILESRRNIGSETRKEKEIMYPRIANNICECMAAIKYMFEDPESTNQVRDILIEPFNFIRDTYKISPYHDNFSNTVH